MDHRYKIDNTRNIKNNRRSSYRSIDHTSKIITRNKKVFDSYKNAMSGFGGQFDPMNRLIYNMSTVLSRADEEMLYRQDWLTRKIIEVIPDDITRKWIDIHIGDDSIVQYTNKKIKELKVIKKFKEALINARLYKGSIIILGIINGQLPYEPLDYDNIDDLLYLNVIDASYINVKSYYKDPFKANYGEPEFYRINTMLRPDVYNTNANTIHESRLIRFDGAYLPELTRRTNNGWHDSILNSINQALKQYGTSMQSGALLFQDFISKILKIPNLGDLLQSEDGRRALELRLQYAIANFSNLGIVLIGEDEEFTKAQTPISGLAELMDKYIEVVSASSNVPRSRLFGQSLGTLAGATETTRAYYDYCAAYQIDYLDCQIRKLIKILLKCKNSITKGVEPPDWDFKFCSLWDETNKEVTTARKMQAQVDEIYIEKKVLTPEEVTISRFRPDGYSFDTIVDINKRIGTFWEEQAKNKENDFNKFESPNGKNAPPEVKKILDSSYSLFRSQWIKNNPNDKENKDNKKLCEEISNDVIKQIGWHKNSKGKWIKK